MSPFTPSNPDALLDELADPHISLHAVAARHRTTLDALILWMNLPDIAAKLEAFRNACAARARFVATTYLPNCAHHLNAIVETHMAEARAPAKGPTNGPTSGPATTAANSADQPEPLALALSRFRRLESARRAIASLIRIARWNDPRPRSQEAEPRSPLLTPSQMGVSAGGGLSASPDTPLASPILDAPQHGTGSARHTTTEVPSTERFQTLVAALSQSWQAAIAAREQRATETAHPQHDSGAVSKGVPPVQSTTTTHDARAGPRWRSAQSLPPVPSA